MSVRGKDREVIDSCGGNVELRGPEYSINVTKRVELREVKNSKYQNEKGQKSVMPKVNLSNPLWLQI